MGDEERLDALPGNPVGPTPDDDREATLEVCETDRASLTAHETADCAGAELADAYENEEDGGS